MTSLAKKIEPILEQAFQANELPAELGAVRVSDRPDLAQFQCNGAMAAAKIAKANPREIASKIVTQLERNDSFEKLDIAGPGFINIVVSDIFLSKQLGEMYKDERLGISNLCDQETVVLDYGGMNVAKAMHVGHLRSLAIGDCLKRLHRFYGYNALGDIHLGDWGLQMGQIISEFEILHPEWTYFDENFDGEYPKTPPFDYAELEKIYPQASAACKEDKERLELARKATMELQNGRKGYRALWQSFLDLSIQDIKSNISLLDVDFEIWKGESDVNDLLPEITKDLNTNNVSETSDGAVIIRVAEEDDKDDIPPLIYLKSDGAATYGTTDIATIYDRIKTHTGLSKIIYETDLRQNLHFEQVFRASRKVGYLENVNVKHIGHGTVNGPDGKPFKTREGSAMKFADMIALVIRKAKDRLDEAELAQDLDEAERNDIAQKIAVSVLKFTELSNQPHMDYIFDIDRVTSFEGKTGPYLLYQAVRIKSLLNKAKAQNISIPETPNFQFEDEDRKLALLLCELPDHFDLSLKNYSPHILCDYAYKLAQTFSSFYGQCHILSEENEALRNSHLALCAQTSRQLEMILGLLGIKTPERM